ncbi:MAG: hypothetical protein AAF664_15440 [Planctomycetota bacterium]
MISPHGLLSSIQSASSVVDRVAGAFDRWTDQSSNFADELELAQKNSETQPASLQDAELIAELKYRIEDKIRLLGLSTNPGPSVRVLEGGDLAIDPASSESSYTGAMRLKAALQADSNIQDLLAQLPEGSVITPIDSRLDDWPA